MASNNQDLNVRIELSKDDYNDYLAYCELKKRRSSQTHDDRLLLVNADFVKRRLSSDFSIAPVPYNQVLYCNQTPVVHPYHHHQHYPSSAHLTPRESSHLH